MNTDAQAYEQGKAERLLLDTAYSHLGIPSHGPFRSMLPHAIERRRWVRREYSQEARDGSPDRRG